MKESTGKHGLLAFHSPSGQFGSSLLLATLITVILVFSASVKATALETVTVKLSTIPQLFYLDGVVEAVHQSTLSAQRGGQVTEINFDVGDFVEKGQMLLVFDDTEHKALVKQAEANVKSASASVQDTSSEYKRIKDIYAKKLTSKADLDKAEANLQKAKASLDASSAALDQARKQLEYSYVKAPFAGIVTQRHIELGETAQPGKLLMSGISLVKLRVVVDVPQSLVNNIRHEGKAHIDVSGKGDWVEAEKLTIFPLAEKKSNTFQARLTLPESVTGLLPGMYVKTSFVTGLVNVLQVPHSAVVYRSEVTGVYIVGKQGDIIFRHVRLGHASNSHHQIVLSGLYENDEVAIDPIAAGTLLKQQRNRSGSHD